MPSNFLIDDPILGRVDTDDVFVTDAWLVDQFVGNQLWTAGHNNNGILGLSDIVHRSSPVQVGALTNWSQVAAAGDGTGASTGIIGGVSAGIKTDGSLWSWGQNTWGGLGLGDLTHRSSPVQVGTLTNWKQVVVGVRNCLAIKTDGSLWSWGQNIFGELGLGDTTSRSSPVQVGSLTNWKQIAVGLGCSAAIKTDGTLWTCGWNGFGQLGLGDTTNRSSPVQVGSLTNWKQVACGYNQTFAIKTDGTLWAWGDNSRGQLGLGDTTSRSSPVQVGTLTNWKQIATGVHIGCAIKTDGTLWVWGNNNRGQLGLMDFVHRSSPVQVGSLTNWKQVSVSIWGTSTHSCAAIKTDGTLWSWGGNEVGQLGLMDLVHRSSPVQVGSLTNWKQVSMGTANMAAITYTEI